MANEAETRMNARRHRGWWTGAGTHAALVFAVSLMALLQYDLLEYPILEDRAYLLYLGQTVLRGDSIYAVSYINYPPTGPLVAALSMRVGGWFGLPTYLAPRFAGVRSTVAMFLCSITVMRATTSQNMRVCSYE